MKKIQKQKLEVSLIPAKAWGRNVRAVVSESSWFTLRSKFGAIFDAYKNYPALTEPLVCSGCGKSFSENLHLHEKWEFDDENLIQKLSGFVAICEDCHNAIHMGRANLVGVGDSAREHIKKVNSWTDSQLIKHLNDASSQWSRRIDLVYQLDLSWLLKEGLLSEREIHLNWLNRPPRVFDRLGAISWAKAILDSDNAVILDTETTGLMEGPLANPNAEIIELAIISIEGKVLYNGRFKPRYSIPQRTTEIHGITNQAVKGAPRFSKEFPEILNILSGKIVICYNTRFDSKVLANTCGLHKLTAPDDVMWECAMKIFKAYREPSSLFSKLPGAKHNALSDCKATLKLIKKMSQNADILCAQ